MLAEMEFLCIVLTKIISLNPLKVCTFVKSVHVAVILRHMKSGFEKVAKECTLMNSISTISQCTHAMLT
jgi:hypothetical protein